MSRHPLHHRLLLAITAFMTLAGCADEAGPGPSDGAYPLARLNDQPMPYDHEGLGCCTYLEGGLELAEGTYAISLAARNRNTSEVFALREWGKATARGPSLTFKPDSFEVIGLRLDVATLTGDSIRVAFGGEGPGSPDQFQALFVRAP
jgi:hypothetical protein